MHELHFRQLPYRMAELLSHAIKAWITCSAGENCLLTQTANVQILHKYGYRGLDPSTVFPTVTLPSELKESLEKVAPPEKIHDNCMEDSYERKTRGFFFRDFWKVGEDSAPEEIDRDGYIYGNTIAV